MKQLGFFTEESSRAAIDPETLQALLAAKEIAIDIETESGDDLTTLKEYGLSYIAPMTTLATAWKQGDAYHSAVWFGEQIGDDSMVKMLQAVFYDPSKTVIAHNAVFDCRHLARYTEPNPAVWSGLLKAKIWDTMTMERLLAPAPRRQYGLLACADYWKIAYPTWMQKMKKARANLDALPADTLQEYAAADALLALKIYEMQRQDRTVDISLIDTEIAAIGEYARMAAQGVKVNQGYLEQRLGELKALAAQLSASLAKEGLTSPNSPIQRQKYLYTTHQIPLPDKDRQSLIHANKVVDLWTDGGKLATGGDVIEALADTYPKVAPLAAWIDVDRMIANLENLQAHALLDGRVHALTTIGTETGRRSSGHPNLQNIKMRPKSAHDPAGDMAGILVADAGACLIEIDFSNAENMTAAMQAADDNLAAATRAADFHAEMASVYFGQAWTAAQSDPEDRDRLRSLGKGVTFGTAYGMGTATLAKNLNISMEKATAILAAKDSRFIAVARAKKTASNAAAKNGYVTLWTGRKVAIAKDSAFTAWNYLNQGAVGEMIKISIVRIGQKLRQEGLQSRVALDMHDALIIEAVNGEQDRVLQLCSEIMEGVIPEELNHRTNPPIRWIARPDLKKNAKKWGKFQTAATPAESPKAAPVPDPQKAKTGKKYRIVLEYELLDYRGELILIDSQPDPVSLEKLQAGKNEALKRKLLSYEICPEPIRTSDGGLAAGNPKTRTLIDYIRICNEWIGAGKSDPWILKREQAIWTLETLTRQFS